MANNKFTSNKKSQIPFDELDENNTCPEGTTIYDEDGAYNDLMEGESAEKKNFTCSNESDIEDTVNFHEDTLLTQPTRKKVVVKTNVNHKCCYGGEWYYFEKGVKQSVPEELKNVLNNAGLLLPI